MTKRIILVHGTAHDQRCWASLAPMLEEHQFEVHALSLPGHGENRRQWFDVGMDTYVEAVCRLAESLGGDCTLLGHSMGGMVISMAAERRPELFRRLIYLTALVPDGRGRSIVQEYKLYQNPGLDQALRFHPLIGALTFDSILSQEVFYGNCTDKVQQEFSGYLSAQPLRPYFARLKWTPQGLGTVPKSYIRCSRDKALLPHVQGIMVARQAFERVVTLPSDHSPFLSMPQRLAKLIDELVQEKTGQFIDSSET